MVSPRKFDVLKTNICDFQPQRRESWQVISFVVNDQMPDKNDRGQSQKHTYVLTGEKKLFTFLTIKKT